MLKSIAIISGLVLITSNLIPAFAGYDPNYEINGRLIYGKPLVCAVEFEDPNISPSSIDKILDESRLAISEWKGQLKNTERYLKDQEKWNIDFTIVGINEKDDFDFSKCFVIIQFEATPENPEYFLEFLGVTEPLGELRSKILIFYMNIVTCVSKESDAKYIYTNYDPCYSNKHMPFTQIGSTLRHEFGHALGLGHYKSDNQKVNENWAKGDATAPSIMIVFAHDNPKKNPITVLDIETIVQLYGENGFLEPNELEIPDWIRNNARWWSEGSISDDDFVSGIQYLIERKIMVIPNPEVTGEPALPFLPNWIKDTAMWWADGKVTDGDFVNGLQYLISHGIIRV